MYNFMDLVMVITMLIAFPCSIIITIAGSIIWYKRWEARDFTPKEKVVKEKRRRRR